MKPRINRLQEKAITNSPLHLVIFLVLLAACNSATPADLPGGTSSEETAIEQFIASAPSANEQNEVLPTALPKSASGLTLPAVNPAQLVGDISLAGNSNLLPLTEQLYKRFVADGYPGFLKMESSGTTAGIQSFCRNDPAQPSVDIVATTRMLLEEELDRCLRLGRHPLALWVGLDALVVVVPNSNNFVKDVSISEVPELFKVRRWSDVNSAWPRRGIITVLPGQSSDDLALFVDLFFAGDLQRLLTKQDTFFTQDDIETIQEILDTPDTIGVINYASYLQNKEKLHLVKIANKAPDLATIHAGEWPLSRPLLLYTTVEVLQSKAQVRSFLTYYLTYLNEEITQVGKFPLTDTDLNHSKLNLLEGTANEAWLADLRASQTGTGATRTDTTSTITVTRTITGQ